MASTDSSLIPGYGQPSPTSQQNIDWGGIINSGVGALSNVYDNYINAQMQAAGMANAASAAAQQAQYQMNSDLMSAQYAYNMQTALEANKLQKELQEQAMKYNAEEAEKQRSWQTKMSATAYQRAVADMRAAGINPILAATNGGANVGSGASASISTAKAAQSGGVSGSGVGNYTGQGYHLSDTFATFGAILGTVGNILSGLQATNAGQGVQNYIQQGIKDITTGIGKGVQDAAKSYYNWYKDNTKWLDNPYTRMVMRQWNDIKDVYNKTFWSKGHTGGGGGHYF